MSESKRAGRPPYPPEVRERAVRLVFEHQGEYPSQWKAIESISAKLSINHETLRQWVRRAETDAGARPGLTTDERARMRALERENRELRRANEMAESTGGRTGPVTITVPRSQECRHGGHPHARAEAAGVPTSGPGLAARGHRREVGCTAPMVGLMVRDGRFTTGVPDSGSLGRAVWASLNERRSSSGSAPASR